MPYILWMIALSFLSLGTLVALLRFHRIIPEKNIFEPITILKPLKGVDSGLAENIESFFQLDYPKFEILFTVADLRDPSISIVRDLQSRYPKVNSRLFIGEEKFGHNPKVNNLAGAYDFASFDLLLISDSNVRARKNYLCELAAEWKPGVGVITAVVAGIEPEGLGGWLESIYLNTFYTRGLNLAFATGNPCVVGKSMLFRKSVAESFGGIRALGSYLAEDYVIGENIRKLGLKIVLMKRPIEQFIGKYSFQEFWKRHIRWGRIRKAHAPLPFLIEPLSMAMVNSLLGAITIHHFFSVPFASCFLSQLGLCFLADAILCAELSDLRWQMPIAWLTRELLALPLWLATGSGSSIDWRGNSFQLHRGGRITKGGKKWNEEISFGELLPLPTK